MSIQNPTSLELKTHKVKSCCVLCLIISLAIYFETSYFVKSKVSGFVPSSINDKLLYIKTNN